MKEYAFDVRLSGTVRINAPSLDHARSALSAVMDAAQIGNDFIGGFNAAAVTSRQGVAIVSADLTEYDEQLVEIDGDEPTNINGGES